MENNYKYDAFISYRHVSPDKEIADKLQKQLESYKPPKSLSKGKKSGGWRVFRDETELPSSSNLSSGIKTALEESEFLIVVCSESTAESPWCTQEVEYFKELHNGNNSNIITVVADGNPKDVFLPALCTELIPVTDESGNTSYQSHTIEPLAANVAGNNLKESLKKLNTEFLRIAAPILGCGYDDLYKREHKKKIRRFFTFGIVFLLLMLLFLVYNSTMLWQINNQKVALAAAYDDLQKKTEELDRSNENLKKSNDDLAKKTAELNLSNENLTKSNADLAQKTKEAEDNLAEAEKQRTSAENNLAEAEKQRQKAEENLAEANRQKVIAEDNMRIALDNENKAQKNAEEARQQKQVAESNMHIAQDNERKARIANSEILATQAQMYLENDDTFAAVESALEALPKEGEDIPVNTTAEYVLASALNAYDSSDAMISKNINLTGYVHHIEFSEDGTRLFAVDKQSNIYVIDFKEKEIIKRYTPMELFEIAHQDYPADIRVVGNNGLALYGNKLVSINLTDGSINWPSYKASGYSASLITNPQANYIFLLDTYSYSYLTKDGTEVLSVDYSNFYDESYHFPNYNDKERIINENKYYPNPSALSAYMDAEGTVYIVRSEYKHIQVINQHINKICTVNIPDDSSIFSITGNKESLFLNIAYNYDDKNWNHLNRRLICINKKDFSEIWSQEINNEADFAYRILTLSHELEDENKNKKKYNGIAVISEKNILCFDVQTGEKYYNASMDDGEKILYWVPNANKTGIIYTTQNGVVTTGILGRDFYYSYDESNITPIDRLKPSKRLLNYFNENIISVASSSQERFALAFDNSPAISLFYNTPFENSNPIIESNINILSIADDVQGTIALAYSYYNDFNRYIAIYDTKNQVLRTPFKSTLEVSGMAFQNNKLLVVDQNLRCNVMDYSGNILEAFDLDGENSHSIKGQVYVTKMTNHIVVCGDMDVYYVDLSKDKVAVKRMTPDKKLGYFTYSYDKSGDLISFRFDNQKYGGINIGYFIDGDEQISYVTEKEKPAEDILSIANTNSGNKIAFTSSEGYIGIYSRDNKTLAKILLQGGEIKPQDVIFTPDGNFLIVTCADGKIRKYDSTTGELKGEYESDYNYFDIDFMDNNSFYITKITSNDPTVAVILNINTMQKRAEIKDFAGYIESEKKIIYNRLTPEGNYEVGYYNYLSTDELRELGTKFLNGE